VKRPSGGNVDTVLTSLIHLFFLPLAMAPRRPRMNVTEAPSGERRFWVDASGWHATSR
jgi:hypothetical protein